MNPFGASFVLLRSPTNSPRSRVILPLQFVEPLVDDASSEIMVHMLLCLAI
jgi:hypothetical protein